jgi:ABC-type nitrate/sulfonate/bicarbonate transport system permease component
MGTRSRTVRFSPLATPTLRDNLCLVAVLVIAWEVLAVTRPAWYMPRLAEIISSYWDLLAFPSLTGVILPSLGRVALGLVIGSTTAFVAGVIVGHLRRLEPWLAPVIDLLRSFPPAVIIPPAMLVLGAGSSMKVFVISFAAFFPVFINCADATRRMHPILIDTGKVYVRGVSRNLRHVVVPAVTPYALTGVRIACGSALVLMVISEMVGGQSGIGAYLIDNQRLFRSPNVYAGVLWIGTFALAFHVVVSAAERALIPWFRVRKEAWS